jgi:hypothetical protein
VLRDIGASNISVSVGLFSVRKSTFLLAVASSSGWLNFASGKLVALSSRYDELNADDRSPRADVDMAAG